MTPPSPSPLSRYRLDRFLVDTGKCDSRQKAQAMILAGRVLVDGRKVDKTGFSVPPDAVVEITGQDIPYVSRGGLKLAHALDTMDLSVDGSVCLDVGASTGGFTDCLLQHGACRVYAVDVGYGQLAWRLRNDPRVVVIERTNIRYLKPETIPERVDAIVIDVSFISLRIVVPSVLPWMKPDGDLIALIKPQFEVGKGRIGKGGVVKDTSLHREIIDDLTDFFHAMGLIRCGLTTSPITGPKGNTEFLIHLRPAPETPGI